MTLNQLIYFKEVAENNNFHKAAEALHIAQPSLSKAIANLESEIGIQLFKREHHQITLTVYGRLFLEQITPALNQFDSAMKLMSRLTDVSKGMINLGYLPPLPVEFVPNCVRNYLQAHPGYDIHFTFSQAPTKYLINGLHERAFDVIYCTYQPDQTDIEFVPVMVQELIAIVPFGHPLENRGEISIVELQPYDFIAYSKSSSIYAALTKYFDNAGFCPRKIYEMSHEDGIASLVSNGFGVSSILNVPSVKNIAVKRIKVAPPWGRVICMAYLKNSYLPPSVEAFIRFLKKNYCDYSITL